MLPSMPVLFTRESQDAFGNKVSPSTSFFNQFSIPKSDPQQAGPTSSKAVEDVSKVIPKEAKIKPITKKKEDPPQVNVNALEQALIKSYYTKVQSRFSSNHSVPGNKFVQFTNILQSFNPSCETPVDLYRQIEQLFGEEHKDLVEEFLLFLKPGQAAQVGRFMDYFLLVQMTGFIELLQTTLARKPTVLRKVLRALTAGINSGSSTEMRTRVYPHLRSNPRLLKMFQSLIPDERPPDSVYENGTDMIHENFISCDKGYDVWEFDGDELNKKKLDDKESLDTVYLHGRVFLQRGRILRNASVTYPYSKEPYRVHARRLAPPHCYLSPPESEEERASPKRNTRTNLKITPKRTKKQLKSPVKSTKDVNDNTKKDISSPRASKAKQNNNKNKMKDKIELLQKKEKEKKADLKTHLIKKEDVKLKHAKADVVIAKIDLPLNKQVQVKNKIWTRDEDKTMLQVLKGEAGSEQMFGRIMELLPHRSATEIKERFYHVMNLLQQMAVGGVT